MSRLRRARPLETRLVGLWEELIGVRPIGVTDDFFALGGHSLLAVRLFAAIEKEFDRRLPLASLFQGATVADLARLVAVERPPASNVVPIKPDGSRRPFFCVHGLFGDPLNFRNLALQLGDEQPFYGLRAVGLEDGEQPLTRIEDIAARYVTAVRTVQPEGPYAVGGLCSGGVVAYEMAQQLRAQGQPVDLVALLDVPALDAFENDGSSFRDVVRGFLKRARGATELTRSQWRDLLQTKFVQTRTRLRARRLASADERQTLEVDDVADFLELSPLHRAVGAALSRALATYAPEVYPGRLTLFRPRFQPLFGRYDIDDGWERLAGGGLEIKATPGNALGMLTDPHVRALSRELRAALDRRLRRRMSVIEEWQRPPEGLVLRADEVHVWLADLDVELSTRASLIATLSPDERRRARGYRSAKDGARFSVSRGVLRQILSVYSALPPKLIRFAYGRNGKPALADEPRLADLRFNLSRRGATALFAVARGRDVGVDLEPVDPTFATREVAERFFSPCEVRDARRTAGGAADRGLLPMLDTEGGVPEGARDGPLDPARLLRRLARARRCSGDPPRPRRRAHALERARGRAGAGRGRRARGRERADPTRFVALGSSRTCSDRRRARIAVAGGGGHGWSAGASVERIGQLLGPVGSFVPRPRTFRGVVYHAGRGNASARLDVRRRPVRLDAGRARHPARQRSPGDLLHPGGGNSRS